MTPADVLATAEAEGFVVVLRDDGSPVVKCPTGRVPNAALRAALAEHKAGIVALLGGERPREWCGTVPNPSKVSPDGVWVCEAWVYQAVDSPMFCAFRNCPFRRRARGEGGPI